MKPGKKLNASSHVYAVARNGRTLSMRYSLEGLGIYDLNVPDKLYWAASPYMHYCNIHPLLTVLKELTDGTR